MRKYDSYIICTSPRSGSTLLCKLLAATGVAGRPESYFHAPSIASWLEYFDLPNDDTIPQRHILRSIFQAAVDQGRNSSDIFALRLQRHSVDFFLQNLAVLHPEQPNDATRFHAAFGRILFIHLTRLDKVEQAISYLKAHQSGLWHKAADGSELERLSAPKPLVYDAQAIRQNHQDMTAFDVAWKDWFTKEQIKPLCITYEALAADPVGSLAQILETLGQNPNFATSVMPGVAKLADETCNNWAARFRREQEATPNGGFPVVTG